MAIAGHCVDIDLYPWHEPGECTTCPGARCCSAVDVGAPHHRTDIKYTEGRRDASWSCRDCPSSGRSHDQFQVEQDAARHERRARQEVPGG
jgi:hypothetical protein